MGTTLISSIIDDCRSDLLDDNIDDWTNAELLEFANRVQRQIAIHKPDASTEKNTVQLVAGTRQTVPSDSIAFVKLLRNQGTTGSTVGNAITFIADMEYFSQMNPTWHTATASATVESYLFDPREPKVFYVYPPQPSSSMGYVDEVDVVNPAEMSAVTSAITLDDIYVDAYKAGIKSYCYKNDKYIEAFPNRWQTYWQHFLSLLGVKEENENRNEPTA